MRFWILTAIALFLASGPIAADDVRTTVNSLDLRRIKITEENDNFYMQLSILREFDPGSPQISPIIFSSSLIVNGRVPANTVNPWFDNPLLNCGDGNNCWDLSRNLWIYVLSLKLCSDDPRDVLVLQPQMNTFGQFDGSFSTKAYMADNEAGKFDDAPPYPWGLRVMTETVEVVLRRETFDGVTKGFELRGSIPGICED